MYFLSALQSCKVSKALISNIPAKMEKICQLSVPFTKTQFAFNSIHWTITGQAQHIPTLHPNYQKFACFWLGRLQA
jgi:hypothetical protein